ncbi:hypothetical protein [Candidatus Palauibacter sp.]|uniref:hypothetical protein n=1 Tax=Candidatus Palauibacter sp. TaxID=3101350 RepID=UPI003D10DB1A
MIIRERDKVVFGALHALADAGTPGWVENVCGYLRESGYRTERDGSIVNQVTFVLRHFVNNPDRGWQGYRIVEVQPDLYALVEVSS